MGKKVKKLVSIGGILAAPFTGGASLALTAGVSAADALSQKAPKAAGSQQVETPGAAPTAVSDETLDAREAQRKRQLAAAGLGGNVLTGASGLSDSAYTSGKSLLGS